MTLEELRLIRDFITEIGRYLVPETGEFKRIQFILNREIKLKELDPRKEKKFKPHKNTCPAYGNYQPPYEECDCGADE